MVNEYFGNGSAHVVAESMDLLATTYGKHIFDVKAGANIDNGKLGMNFSLWLNRLLLRVSG